METIKRQILRRKRYTKTCLHRKWVCLLQPYKPSVNIFPEKKLVRMVGIISKEFLPTSFQIVPLAIAAVFLHGCRTNCE